MKTRDLTPKQLLLLRCPTCGAKPGEKCELATGQPRVNPHRDRRLVTAEFVELMDIRHRRRPPAVRRAEVAILAANGRRGPESPDFPAERRSRLRAYALVVTDMGRLSRKAVISARLICKPPL